VVSAPTPARAGQRRRRGATRRGIQQLPWKQPRRAFPPVDLLSADEIEHIHNASLDILADIGMEFLSPAACAILKKAGCDVDETNANVRFDREMVAQTIKSAPSHFTLHARNPERNLQIGGNFMAFSCISSPPNASDMDDGRRVGNTKDFKNFLKLAQHFNTIHCLGGYPVEPVDRHASIRHLECLRDMITLTDKVISGYCTSQARTTDAMTMARIARGVDHEQFQREPSIMTVVNTNSPLRFDGEMLNGIMEMSAQGQVVIVTPFTLAGAMAPVTLAGALAQQNAEALAGIVMTQLVRPGAPVIYGGFTSNVDMKSGAPAFGTPEYMKGAIIGGQLARRYNIPYRSSNVNAANTVDAQAAYESVFSLWGLTMGGANLVKHAAGWMEGGLTASFEKFVLDADLLQMVSQFLEPVEVTDDTLALDAIRDVGPGGHFFGTQHTLDRYRTAFYAPLISDWRNYESWEEAGSPVAWQKANTIFKQVIEDFVPPPIEPAIGDEIDAFVQKRIEAGGSKTDF